MPMDEAQYFAQRAEADARAAGAAEKRKIRKARESGAARGTLYSGVQTRQEGSIRSETDEQMRQASLDREMERYNAYQRDLDRAHSMTMQESQQMWGTGEREGSQAWQGGQAGEQRAWQTGERMGGQKYGTSEREGTQSFQEDYAHLQTRLQSRLQGQAEQAQADLQEQVHNGTMSEQQAQMIWQGLEAGYDRELQVGMQEAGFGQDITMQGNQFGQDITMQGGQFGQEQWMAGFGATHDIYMGNMANTFEAGMSQQQQGWDIAKQQWDQYMFNLDVQLQLDLDGFDWGDDSYNFLGTQNAAIEQPSGYYDYQGIWQEYYPEGSGS